MRTLSEMKTTQRNREIKKLFASFPDTPIVDLLEKRTSLASRRAKNKRAKVSRRKNRGK